jgi:hypothetical protein
VGRPQEWLDGIKISDVPRQGRIDYLDLVEVPFGTLRRAIVAGYPEIEASKSRS